MTAHIRFLWIALRQIEDKSASQNLLERLEDWALFTNCPLMEPQVLTVGLWFNVLDCQRGEAHNISFLLRSTKAQLAIKSLMASCYFSQAADYHGCCDSGVGEHCYRWLHTLVMVTAFPFCTGDIRLMLLSKLSPRERSHTRKILCVIKFTWMGFSNSATDMAASTIMWHYFLEHETTSPQPCSQLLVFFSLSDFYFTRDKKKKKKIPLRL